METRSKLWRFYIRYRGGENVSYQQRVCIAPNRTKTWRELISILDREESVEGVGYETVEI